MCGPSCWDLHNSLEDQLLAYPHLFSYFPFINSLYYLRSGFNSQCINIFFYLKKPAGKSRAGLFCITSPLFSWCCCRSCLVVSVFCLEESCICKNRLISFWFLFSSSRKPTLRLRLANSNFSSSNWPTHAPSNTKAVFWKRRQFEIAKVVMLNKSWSCTF